MFKKISMVLALVLVFALVVAGCTAPAESSAPVEESKPAAESSAPVEESKPAESDPVEDEIIIGFSQCTMASPFYVSHVEAAEAAAKAAGVKLIVADANEDVTKQNTDILDMLENGIQVLILNAVDPDGVAPALEKCAEKGVKIVTVDRFVNGDVDVVVGRDNRDMGRQVGEAIIAYLDGKEAKILEVMGSGGDRVQEARSGGFHDAVDAVDTITVVQTPYCDYVRSKAATATQDMIQANKDITIVYGHNDDMALGALQVCLDAGMEVVGSGVDGLMEAVEAIKDGKYIATTANDPLAFGRVAVEEAIKLAKGETRPAEADCGTFLIDASNAEQYYNPDLAFASKD